MLGTNRDYIATPAITLEGFPWNESDGTRFSKFHGKNQRNTTKWWSGRSSMTNTSDLEKWNLLLLLQTFQFWICAARNISPVPGSDSTALVGTNCFYKW